jgi:hypothetical protein
MGDSHFSNPLGWAAVRGYTAFRDLLRKFPPGG